MTKEQSTTTGQRVGIGLIGAGRIGSLHAHIVRRDSSSRLVKIYDANRRAAEDLAAAIGAEVTASADELASDPGVDAVYICSPTDTHVEMIALAAKYNKAIFCEKPIDLDIEKVKQCVLVLNQAPVIFSLGFHRRYDAHHRALKVAIEGGAVGKIEQIRIMSRDPQPPPIEYIRRSGGIFRDMMIHDLDQARWLMGKEFVGVFAHGAVLVDADIGAAGDYDTVTATFWTDGGQTCTIQNSRKCTYGFDQRIEIFGSEGRLALDNIPTTQMTLFCEKGLIGSVLPQHFPQRYENAYRSELEILTSAVRGRGQPEAGAADGLWSLVLADAATESARYRKPVNILAPQVE
jgi:myo-inositol 2-dehydrogenase / D-chiro-inositol 1-dehydrogenase